MRVRYRGRVVEAQNSGDRWYVNDPELGEMDLPDYCFRKCFENEFDNIIPTPVDLTKQLSAELKRWGMTPLPLDAPVEATLGLTLAAVRQMNWDLSRIKEALVDAGVADLPVIRDAMEDLICTS